jgi:hypothetical protein
MHCISASGSPPQRTWSAARILAAPWLSLHPTQISGPLALSWRGWTYWHHTVKGVGCVVEGLTPCSTWSTAYPGRSEQPANRHCALWWPTLVSVLVGVHFQLDYVKKCRAPQYKLPLCIMNKLMHTWSTVLLLRVSTSTRHPQIAVIRRLLSYISVFMQSWWCFLRYFHIHFLESLKH